MRVSDNLPVSVSGSAHSSQEALLSGAEMPAGVQEPDPRLAELAQRNSGGTDSVPPRGARVPGKEDRPNLTEIRAAQDWMRHRARPDATAYQRWDLDDLDRIGQAQGLKPVSEFIHPDGSSKSEGRQLKREEKAEQTALAAANRLHLGPRQGHLVERQHRQERNVFGNLAAPGTLSQESYQETVPDMSRQAATPAMKRDSLKQLMSVAPADQPAAIVHLMKSFRGDDCERLLAVQVARQLMEGWPVDQRLAHPEALDAVASRLSGSYAEVSFVPRGLDSITKRLDPPASFNPPWPGDAPPPEGFRKLVRDCQAVHLQEYQALARLYAERSAPVEGLASNRLHPLFFALRGIHREHLPSVLKTFEPLVERMDPQDQAQQRACLVGYRTHQGVQDTEASLRELKAALAALRMQPPDTVPRGPNSMRIDALRQGCERIQVRYSDSVNRDPPDEAREIDTEACLWRRHLTADRR